MCTIVGLGGYNLLQGLPVMGRAQTIAVCDISFWLILQRS